MTFKILQLCFALVSTFKEFVEFSLSSVAQSLKLLLQTQPLLKKFFSTVTFCQYDFRICNLHYLDQKTDAHGRRRGG